MPVPRPVASLHLTAGMGVGSLGTTTIAVRTSVAPVYWFRPNVGIGLDLELAAQSQANFSSENSSHAHTAVAAAIACRAPLRKPLLVTVTVGGYSGRAEQAYQYARPEGPTVGGLLGFRLAYMGQIRPAEIGPVLSLGMAIRPDLPWALSATLGLQGGFTVFKRSREQLPHRWASAPQATSAAPQSRVH